MTRRDFRPARRLGTAVAAGAAALALAVPAASATPAAPPAPSSPSWRLVDTGGTNHFRGLSVVNRNVVWLGGYNGQVLRTVDGGRHWTALYPDGPSSTLQFRDIQAFDANHAVAMAAGTTTDSRLYATFDGGQHWRLAYENTASTAFFDCMSFFNPAYGLVLSDPVDGKFRILSTSDGGAHWHVNSSAGMPAAMTGEAGFAASGECLTTLGTRDAWFGSGGITTPRIFHSRDGGLTWTASAAPLAGSPSAGVFALAFRSPSIGVATGGDFAHPNMHRAVAATQLFDAPWQLAPTQPSGYRSGVTWVPNTRATVIAVGLNGSDVSTDGGYHWSTFDDGQFDTVSCAPDGSCWAAGDLGRVAVLQG